MVHAGEDVHGDSKVNGNTDVKLRKIRYCFLCILLHTHTQYRNMVQIKILYVDLWLIIILYDES